MQARESVLELNSDILYIKIMRFILLIHHETLGYLSMRIRICVFIYIYSFLPNISEHILIHVYRYISFVLHK